VPRPVDDLVYAAPDGASYVAHFDDAVEDDPWYCWPAVAHGWRQRVRCSEATADDAEELPPRLGELALRLSGVPDD
jgi:hypothetical protein